LIIYVYFREDVLTKEEIKSWRRFVDSLSSKEDRELFENMLMVVKVRCCN
jgi:hypothetical protein